MKVAKFLDSSLIDVDVHPTYLSLVIKSKVLRLRLPAEVKSTESKCQRSKTTGSLLVIMPKLNPKENAVTLRVNKKIADQNKKSSLKSNVPKKLSLQEQIMQEALKSSQATHEEKEKDNSDKVKGISTELADCNLSNKTKPIDVKNIVKKREKKDDGSDTIFEFPNKNTNSESNLIVELD